MKVSIKAELQAIGKVYRGLFSTSHSQGALQRLKKTNNRKGNLQRRRKNVKTVWQALSSIPYRNESDFRLAPHHKTQATKTQMPFFDHANMLHYKYVRRWTIWTGPLELSNTLCGCVLFTRRLTILTCIGATKWWQNISTSLGQLLFSYRLRIKKWKLHATSRVVCLPPVGPFSGDRAY